MIEKEGGKRKRPVRNNNQRNREINKRKNLQQEQYYKKRGMRLIVGCN